MSPRTYAIIVAGLVAVIGIIMLMLPVHADAHGSTTGLSIEVSCGTAVSNGVDLTDVSYDSATVCSDARSERTVWALILIGVGLVVGAGAVVVQRPRQQQDPTQQQA